MSNPSIYAYVFGGRVINVAVSSPENAEKVPFPFDSLHAVSDKRPSIGWTYNPTDGFRPPQPYPSWTWSGSHWSPPKPAPTDPGRWIWDESTGDWVNIEASTEAE